MWGARKCNNDCQISAEDDLIHVFLAVLLVVLAAGLAASFFDGATLFAGAFRAATLAFVLDEVPVTDFLAAPRLEGATVFLGVVVVLDLGLATGFLGIGFFTVGFGFSASAFFAGALLVVEGLALVVVALVVVALVVVALVVLALDAGLVADLVVVVDLGLVADLEVGLFSLVAASVDLDLGANLTLPEGPLGRVKIPFCSPEVMALDN